MNSSDGRSVGIHMLGIGVQVSLEIILGKENVILKRALDTCSEEG
jgi:hypothetical protein